MLHRNFKYSVKGWSHLSSVLPNMLEWGEPLIIIPWICCFSSEELHILYRYCINLANAFETILRHEIFLDLQNALEIAYCSPWIELGDFSGVYCKQTWVIVTSFHRRWPNNWTIAEASIKVWVSWCWRKLSIIIKVANSTDCFHCAKLRVQFLLSHLSLLLSPLSRKKISTVDAHHPRISGSTLLNYPHSCKTMVFHCDG